MRFGRVRLKNWRNFKEVDVALQNRVFLVGPNASGKSNFLDVFRFLHDLVVPGGGFEQAIRMRGGVSRLRNLAARSDPNVMIDVELNDKEQTHWRYYLEFSQDPQRRPKVQRESVWRGEEQILSRPDSLDRQDAARLRQTHLEQTFANQLFREIADFFASIYYLHLVPQLVRQPERWQSKEHDPYGSDLLEHIAKEAKRTQEARLRRIRRALETAVPQLEELRLRRDKRGIPHIEGRYHNWRPRGVWQNESDFSDGTLRLIGLLWALQEGEGPLLLEEPELSLHPEIVRHIPEMMSSVQRDRKRRPRQVLVSTHSSDLLAGEGIGAKEILLFEPSNEGSRVKLGADVTQIRQMLEAGIPAGEVVLPYTAPKNARQLVLWG